MMAFRDKRDFSRYHFQPLPTDISESEDNMSTDRSLNINNSRSFYSDTTTTVLSDSFASTHYSDIRALSPRSETVVNLNQSAESDPPAEPPKRLSSTSKLKRRRSSKRLRSGALGFILKVIRSDPSEYRLLKACFGFPIGVLIGAALYFVIIQPLDFDPDVKKLAGALTTVGMSLGFGFNVQVRAIVLLVLPTFFGKAGRNYIAAFAIVFVVSGPIANIVDNCREVARSLSCLAQLLANHTLTKWKLRLSPLKLSGLPPYGGSPDSSGDQNDLYQEAVEELQEEGFLIGQIGSIVKGAFAPLQREMEDKTEVDQMEQDIKEVEAIVAENQENGQPPNPFGVDDIEDKYKPKPGDDEGQVIEEQWEKKLDLRCDDIFSRAIIKCRDWFGDMEQKCMDALWILGYVLCLPLKMTFFCDLMRIITGALGMDCNSMDVIDPGVGETYKGSKDMIGEVSDGMKVNMQYRVVGGGSSLNYMTAEEIRAGTMYEFESKAGWFNFWMLMFKRIAAFTFLLVFKEAYDYNKGFLTNYQHDNVYVTKYFRKIDARRKDQGKRKLLPLKKTERQVMIYPWSWTLMAREQRDLKSGTVTLLLKVMVTAIIMYVDVLFVWVLDVVNRNSEIEYHETGKNVVRIEVFGEGFMAQIVRMFLVTLNTNKTLDYVSTNADCLPRAKRPNWWKNALIFFIYFCIYLFMMAEAYGLRLRRVICAFFYRKREKRRVLYVYNELLKKRKGYLRHMRHQVRKQIRDRTLQTQTSLKYALKRQFPRLCACLGFFEKSQDSCLICKDPEDSTFVRCQTDGCGWGYCQECWGDVKKRCYACGAKSDAESGSEFSSSDDSDLTDDERFLR